MFLRQQIRNLWFYLVLAVFPVIYVEGVGISYREPKTIVFWLSAAIMLWLLSSEKERYQLAEKTEPDLLYWLRALSFGYCALSFFSILYAQNFGLALERSANLLAALIFAFFVYHRQLELRKITFALSVSLYTVTILNMLRTFWDIKYAYLGGGLGGFIGERNPCAIFLAGSLPLVVASLVETVLKRSYWAFYWGLLSQMMVLSIIISRCRNAWWMIFIYFILYIVLGFRNQQRKPFAMSAMVIALTALTTITVINVVPMYVAWRSDTPYQESLLSMADPNRSNGRIDLWKVGLVMAQENPFLGLGAGNAIIHLRSYVPYSSANPLAFGFLRSDLPLFNDYLQAFVENGVLGGIIFLLIFAGMPVWCLIRILKSREPLPLFLVAGIFTLIGFIWSANLDFPFIRVESLMLFSVVFSYVLRTMFLGKSIGTIQVLSWQRICSRILSIGFVTLTLYYGTSFFLRRYDSYLGQLPSRVLSWNLWRYDTSWMESFIFMLNTDKENEFLDRYIYYRNIDWPFEPRTHLAAGLVAEYRHDYKGALAAYRRGLLEVPGGRCNWYVWREMDRFWRRQDVDPAITLEAKNMLYDCSKKIESARKSSE